MDKGFKINVLFLLWLGIAAGLPCIILGDSVAITGSIACCAIFPAIAIASNAKEGTFKKECIVTYGHFWVFLAYAIIGMLEIAFTRMEYNDIKDLSQGLIIFVIYPVITFFIETWLNERKRKREYQRLHLGQAFEEEHSREGVPHHMHNKYLEFTRRSIWIIKELHHHNDIRLQDAHFASRSKKVTIDELKKFSPIDGITWYRTPEYYDMVIDSIKDRATKETYRPNDM